MKAWRMYSFGDIRLDEIPEPEVKSGWVVLKVRTVQLSVTEIGQLQGRAVGILRDFEGMIKKKGPIQMFGHEFCGEVVEVGEGVDDLKIGDRVFYYRRVPCYECPLCLAGYEECCHTVTWVGKDLPGALAEYIAVPARTLAAVPESITDSEAAAMQPLDGAVGKVYAARIEMGDTVVILGQGVMGLNTMQISRFCGAGKVIGVDVSDKALELSSKLGADITIDARKEDPVEAVRKITKGVGADVVFECAGGVPEQGLSGSKTLNQALSLVRDEGKIVQIALLTPDVAVPTSTVISKGIHYMGGKYSTYRMINYVINLVASKRIQLSPYISHILEGLEKLPEAIEITANKAKYGATNPAQVVVSH